METAEEQRNRIATDILQCPKCQDEEVELCAHTVDADTNEILGTDFKCLCCGHYFTVDA